MLPPLIAFLAVLQQGPLDSAAAVDKVFAGWTSTASPGCAVGVSRDGKPILARAYGMSNLEHDVPNTPATIFEAGSVSKQFTAAAVALLAIDGRLSLEDPIRKYFPELPEYGDSITIRQMLNHTSGLRDWGVVAAVGGWPRGTRTYTHVHVLDIIKRQKSLNYTPGAEYLYSNSNYNLAAMLVERVSGMSFADFTQTRLFQPLGMTNTSWRDDYARIVKKRSTAYAGNPNVGWRQNMPFENVYGNSSLLTTVGDLLKWNENFVHLAVGGARLAADMRTRGRLNSGRTINYALGLSVDSHRGVAEVNHTGATAGYRAYLARFPEQKLSVALLCNMGSVSPGAIGHQIAEIFLQGQLKPQPIQAASGIRLSPAALQNFAGLYRHVVTGSPARLGVQDTVLRLGNQRFVPVTENAFISNAGTRLEFVDARRVARVVSDGDTTLYLREPEWTPTAGQLRDFVGTYSSDEADASYTVAMKSGQLEMLDRYGRATPLTPTYKDVFTRPGFLVIFRRNASGNVTGLSLGLGRVRDLRFTRTAQALTHDG